MAAISEPLRPVNGLNTRRTNGLAALVGAGSFDSNRVRPPGSLPGWGRLRAAFLQR